MVAKRDILIETLKKIWSACQNYFLIDILQSCQLYTGKIGSLKHWTNEGILPPFLSLAREKAVLGHSE